MPTIQNNMMKEAEKSVITNSSGLGSLNEPIRRLTPNARKNKDNKRTTIFFIRIGIFISTFHVQLRFEPVVSFITEVIVAATQN